MAQGARVVGGGIDDPPDAPSVVLGTFCVLIAIGSRVVACGNLVVGGTLEPASIVDARPAQGAAVPTPNAGLFAHGAFVPSGGGPLADAFSSDTPVPSLTG